MKTRMMILVNDLDMWKSNEGLIVLFLKKLRISKSEIVKITKESESIDIYMKDFYISIMRKAINAKCQKCSNLFIEDGVRDDNLFLDVFMPMIEIRDYYSGGLELPFGYAMFSIESDLKGWEGYE